MKKHGRLRSRWAKETTARSWSESLRATKRSFSKERGKISFDKKHSTFIHATGTKKKPSKVLNFLSPTRELNERFSEFGDRQTQKRCQKEALWFYEGAWNSPDTRKLPDTAREEILQTLCRLCAQLCEKSKAEKYSNEAFQFYEKKLKRNKEGMSEHDRIAILTTLVHMATSQMKEKKKQKYESLLKV